MIRPLQILCVCLALAPLPGRAEAPTGRNDPAYQSAFARLLQADDRDAYARLRDLAAAGNQAAQQSLPFAARWFAIAPTALARAEARQIDGVQIQTLAEAGYGTAQLWQGGEVSGQMAEQLDRALALYRAGETAKGDALLAGWFNHMPGSAALPAGFVDLPAAAWLKAAIVERDLGQGDVTALPVLQAWLEQDRIEGWMVLSQFGDHYQGLGPALVARLDPRFGASLRLQDGRRARALLWDEDPAPPQSPATVEMIVRDLTQRPQFAPVRAYCAAACGPTAPQCQAAFVSLFGQPYRATAAETPFADLMAPEDFFASPRGEKVLLGAALTHHLGLDRKDGYRGALAEHPAVRVAHALDACLVDGALRAQAPFPDNP